MTAGYQLNRGLLLAALVGLLLSLAVVFVPSAEAAGSIRASVSAGIAGEIVTFKGSLPPKRSRPIVLQRKSAGRWVKVTAGKTNAKGIFSISTKIRTTTTTYRVYAKAAKIGTKRYGATATSSKRIKTQAQSGSLSLAGSAQQGGVVKATATFAPARAGRPVVLQRQTGSNWVQVATGTQASNGFVSLPVPTGVVGTFTFRAVAQVFKGAAPVATVSKSITITAEPPVDSMPPPVPSGLVVTAGDGHVGLSWAAVTAPDLAGYNVYRATASGGPWMKLTGSPISPTSYDATGLTNGSQYWFAITSIDATGNESARSTSSSGTPTVAPDTTPPSVPAGLTSTAGDGQVGLSWAAVTAPDLAGYNVYRATAAGGPWTKLTGSPVSATSFDVMGLTNGTQYWFAITSIDAASNESGRSTPATATPLSTPGSITNHCGTLDADEIWVGGVHVLTCAVEIPDGVTLTLSSGAVVKLPANQGDASGFLIREGGRVDAVGTAGSPIVVTSLSDDSVGGDTNGDGPSVGSLDERYRAAFTLVQTKTYDQNQDPESGFAILEAEHLRVRYGYAGITQRALTCWGCAASRAGHVTVSNSSFEYLETGINFTGYWGTSQAKSLEVTDSSFTHLSSTAIAIDAADGKFTGVTIDDANLAISVPSSAAVSFRGSITNVAMGIEGCNWNAGCWVDASHTEWDSAAGPFADPDNPLVCGSVEVDPWVNASPDDRNPFHLPNCDGSPSVADQTTEAAAAAWNRVNDLCAQSPDTCDVIEIYTNCMAAARQLAEDNLPFPTSQEGAVKDFGVDLVEAGGTYLKSSSTAAIADFGAVTSRAGSILDVINVLLSLKRAYDSCP